MQAFSSCCEPGLLFFKVLWLLIAVTSLIAEPELWGAWASEVVVYGLICPMERGIFLDQGSNPCPLHWQADSLLLSHQGSLKVIFYCKMSDLQGHLSQRMHHLYTKHGPTVFSRMLLFKASEFLELRNPRRVFYFPHFTNEATRTEKSSVLPTKAAS